VLLQWVSGWVSGVPHGSLPSRSSAEAGPRCAARVGLGGRESPEGHRWVPWQDQGLARRTAGLADQGCSLPGALCAGFGRQFSRCRDPPSADFRVLSEVSMCLSPRHTPRDSAYLSPLTILGSTTKK